ncbi:MAG TPA: FtsX-like permease family protein [Streptosporangiaceae bacterium]
MGRLLLIFRLIAADLRRRPGEAVMLLVVIMAATTTLTLGLVLHGETNHPYERTRVATAGPDVVANIIPPTQNATGKVTQQQLRDLNTLAHAPGVVGHSGPYPVTWAVLGAHGLTASAEVEGRDRAPASIDQPRVTEGSWIRNGGVVVERTFAEALGVHTGDSIKLNGRSLNVVGIAVTAAFSPYPEICTDGCDLNTPQLSNTPGLVWVTQDEARSLSSFEEPLTYYLNLKLSDPAQAVAFTNKYNNFNSAVTPSLYTWQQISQDDGQLLKKEQLVLMVASWLLGLLAVASVAVLVGGRMAEQIRRVGLLKAVGGTPGLIAGVLLAQYLLLALLAAGAGLALGRLIAPVLAGPGAGLLGTAGPPPVTAANIGVVVAVAVAVAVAAALVPAVRAARISTVRALSDTARIPRRRAWLIALSARLPVPLLIGLRVAARRPRRIVLSVLSIAVTVSGIVAVLFAHASLDASQSGASSGLANPQSERGNQILLIVTFMLVALAAVNAVFITRTTVQDSRHASAVTRALGATPGQITAGLCAAQVLPALAGAVLGITGGIALYLAVKGGGATVIPPIWWFVAVVVGTVIAIAGLTTIPSRLGARRPVVEILRAETA